MTVKEMRVGEIKEHPENKGLFTDIKDTSAGFWQDFKDNIDRFGIIEPLIINKETKYIRSGNQRYKAAVELGMETVPVLLVDDEDSETEIQKMISSNVYRRTIDAFAMFKYIGILRNPSQGKKTTQEEIQKELHKKTEFIGAADIFNSLPEDQQQALEQWFKSQAEGEKAKSEGELIAMVKELEADNTALEQELAGVNDETLTTQERIDELQEMIDKRDIEIDEIRNTDYQEEFNGMETQINELLVEKKKLKKKIKELQESPDINFYLIESVKKQKEINAVLKQILGNPEALNQAKLIELEKAIRRTMDIIRESTNNGQDDRRRAISD